MVQISVTAIGILHTHENGYLVDRPRGLGEWLIMRFRSPFLAQTTDGRVTGGAGDCLVNSPRYPNWHTGSHAGFCNDWVHLRGAGLSKLVHQAGIPVNRLFRPMDSEFVPDLLKQIERERSRQDYFWQQQVDASVRQLLFLLGRSVRQTEHRVWTPAEADHLSRFRDLRAMVHKDMARQWTIEVMADIVCLSESRFQVLYRRFFSISPLQDLLAARIRQSRMLLSNAATSVGQAARACGFDSPAHFSRVFRQRVGVSPHDYQRSRSRV